MGSFSPPPTPPPPPPLPPAAIPPTMASAGVAGAGALQKMLAATMTGKGMGGTLATTPQGDLTKPETAGQTLGGGKSPLG
jgi:hypothetical protein